MKMAIAAGVPIAMGSDCGNYGLEFAQELVCLVDGGLTPRQALVAGTSGAAACMGKSDKFGTLKAGLKANMIIVKKGKDPLADVAVMCDRTNFSMVMKDGQPISGGIANDLRPIMIDESRTADLGRRYFS